MTQQAELFREIDRLPPRYFSQVIAFVADLQQKAQQELEATNDNNEGFSLFDENGKPRFTRRELEEITKDCPITRSLSGILKTDMTLDEIRMERLA